MYFKRTKQNKQQNNHTIKLNYLICFYQTGDGGAPLLPHTPSEQSAAAR
jgi:hypothetical protein